MEFETVPRFFVLQWIEKYLFQWGFSDAAADLITFLVACGLAVLLLWLLNFIGTWILTHIVALAVHRSRTLWDDFLMRRHFFNRIIKCLTGALLLFSARIIFAGYNPAVITGIEVTARVFITVMGALACGSFLDALNDVYNSKPIAKQKSIKGIVQTAKLVIYIIAGIIGIAILLRKDPTQLLVGLGASAAIMSLVFKDTILGFVASIQISAQDMIHPGDWIEMPSKGADGVVTDINVSNVKVRNWNNTITMIPIYSLVSEAFTNWRSMEESASTVVLRRDQPRRTDPATGRGHRKTSGRHGRCNQDAANFQGDQYGTRRAESRPVPVLCASIPEPAPADRRRSDADRTLPAFRRKRN